MAVVTESLLAALRADPGRWPGRLTAEGEQRLAQALHGLPEEVTTSIVSGLLDPERDLWARSALVGTGAAQTAGARVVGMATDDLVELTGPHGEPVGLSPLGFDIQSEGMGDPVAIHKLLDALDGTMGRRRYVLHVRRPVPATVDVEAIAMAVQLWLADLARGASKEQHAHYDDEDVSVELTLVRGGKGKTGRQLTIGPANTLERMHAVNGRVMEALIRHEQSVGSLPVVMVLCANAPWKLARGHVQLLLYGTPRQVSTSRRDGRPIYQALFDPNRSAGLFADGRCQSLASLWWAEPHTTKPHGSGDDDPLRFRSWSHDNPWAAAHVGVVCEGPRFRCIEARPDTSARMQWDL